MEDLIKLKWIVKINIINVRTCESMVQQKDSQEVEQRLLRQTSHRSQPFHRPIPYDALLSLRTSLSYMRWNKMAVQILLRLCCKKWGNIKIFEYGTKAVIEIEIKTRIMSRLDIVSHV